MSEYPPTPKSESEEDLGFVRQPIVSWFAPGILIDTGIKAVLSSIFGAYADKREIQAALHQKDLATSAQKHTHDYSERDELWLDFTADLGDGWDSTYSIAKLLAAEKLSLDHGGANFETTRGKILIMGGDEVYPTATREEYNNRLVGPYNSALPYVKDESPHLFAIPGNHDWYDGLTAFTRLFMQKRWIGGWQTQQSRSYFAIKLPHNWWLWGIDIQLDSDIDQPQLDYFQEVAKKHMKQGDKVILCTAQPDWVFTKTKKKDSYKNLAYFEKSVVHKNGGVIAVTLTGDLHHYCRYEDKDTKGKRQKITCGGGGAYLFPSHGMPESLEIEEGEQTVAISRKKIYPDEKTSKGLIRGAFLVPLKTWSFAMVLGGLYLLFGWVLQSASVGTGESFLNVLAGNQIKMTNFGQVLFTFAKMIQSSPASFVFLLLIVGGLYGFCDARGWRRLIGLVHGLVHVSLNVSLIWLFTHWNSSIGVQVGTFTNGFLFLFEMFTVGGLLGGFVLGVYLFLASRLFGINMNEAFSCQPIADYKCFLRLHFSKDGELTIYPIGVDKVCKKWRFNADAKNGESWFEPKQGHEIKPHLIEEPFKIKI